METRAIYSRTLIDVPAPARGSGPFGLFALLTGVLFVRPAEIFTFLDGAPIYELLIVAAILVASSKLLQQLTPRSLTAVPISACVVCMVLAVFMSHFSHLDFYKARTSATDFAKIAVYFLLLVTTVDTPARLRTFSKLIVVFIAVSALLALLQYHGFLHIQSLEAIQENDYDSSNDAVDSFYRLCGAGIFHDPNDLSLILVVGISLALHFVTDRGEGMRRAFWIAAVVVFAYALVLTRSRGGFIAMMAALLALACTQFGIWRTIALSVIALPLLAVFAAGRQTNIDLEQGTGQDRILLWREGLELMKSSPVFGIGMNQYAEAVRLVAHNSYIHSYTELGMFGGTLFTGAFYFALSGMCARERSAAKRRRRSQPFVISQGTRPLGPYIIAAVLGYGVGLLSLTRVYTVPTYLVLGLAEVQLRTARDVSVSLAFTKRRLLAQLIGFSVLFLIAAHLFIQMAAHHS